MSDTSGSWTGMFSGMGARFAERLQQMDCNMSPETKRRLELYLPSTDLFSDDTLGDPGVRVIQAFVQERTEYYLTNRFKK